MLFLKQKCSLKKSTFYPEKRSTTTLTHFQDFSYNPFFCFRILEPPHASFLHNSVFTGEFPPSFHLNVPTTKLMGNKKGKILYKVENFLCQKIYPCHFIFFQGSPLPFLNMFLLFLCLVHHFSY